MAAIDLTDLTNKVTATEGADDSAVLLITEFVKELNRLAALPTVNPAELQALADRLEATKTKLGDAVAANPDPNPND
jgi:hypothetical protein